MVDQDRTARGYMILSTIEYLDKTYGPDVRRKMIEELPPRARAMVNNVDKVGWYPVEDVSQLFHAICRHETARGGDVVRALETVGRAIANTATTTFLKLVLKVLTPALFAAKMKDFWPRDNRCGQMSCESYDGAARCLTAKLTDVKGYDFIGPVAAGFLLHALDGLGFKNARAEYDFSIDDPGKNEWLYTFRWD